MSDRELLEAAARAAGYTIRGWAFDRLFVSDSNEDPFDWMPLTDDGDAFRLAVRLQMTLKFLQWFMGTPGGPEPLAAAYTADFYGEAMPKHWSDANEAMRRAIVVCAAMIGRGIAE